jgi:hypothetical protein
MRSLFAVAAFGVPLLSLGSSGTALAAQSKDCGVFMPCAAMKADTAETTTPASTRISRRSAALRPAPQATGPVVSGRSVAVTTEGPATARTPVISRRSALRTATPAVAPSPPAPAYTTVQTGYGYQPQPWGWDNYQRPIAPAPVVTGRSVAAIPAAPAVVAAPAPAYTTGYAYQPQPLGWGYYQTPVANAPVVTHRSVAVTPAVVAAPAPAYTTGYGYPSQTWGWGNSGSPWWW